MRVCCRDGKDVIFREMHAILGNQRIAGKFNLVITFTVLSPSEHSEGRRRHYFAVRKTKECI